MKQPIPAPTDWAFGRSVYADPNVDLDLSLKDKWVAVNKPTEVAFFAVLEACVAIFAFTTLSLMFDLGYRLEPLVFEKDIFGIPGWFTVVVLKHRTTIGAAIVLASALRFTAIMRLAEGAKRWVTWIVLAGAELMAFSLWFFVVGSAVLSAAPL